MKSLSLMLKIFAVTIFTLALCSIAQAQATRTWVSGVGNDANPCSRTAPCQTFAGAYVKTSPGGEIDALDSHGFGPVTITNSITIDGGTGNIASILAGGTTAVTVNAGTSDTVILRNISMNGVDTGVRGINYIAGGLVVLDNVTIEKFATGVFAKSSSGANPLSMEINKSRLYGNTVGVQQEDYTFVAIRDSVIVGTLHKGALSFGLNQQPAAGTTCSAKLEHNEISYCNSGVRATGSDFGKGDPTFWARDNHIYRCIVGFNLTVNVTYHSAGGNLLSECTTPFSGGVNAGVPTL